MANTYSQIYIQLVFAVKNRGSFIQESFREDIQKYMYGIVANRGCRLYAIYANPDHVHLLIGLHPGASISDLVRDIKSNTSKYINEKNYIPCHFQWQDGYGAFSYSASQLDNVVAYILNQPLHHRKRSFREEYIDFLQKFKVDYEDKYLFDWDL